MTAQQSTDDIVRIQGEMSIYQASELKQQLLAGLHEERTLVLDLSGVTELDTAGLQLLMLAKRTARTNHCQLQLQGHSTAVLDVFELLNLVGYFGDPIVIPSRAQART